MFPSVTVLSPNARSGLLIALGKSYLKRVMYWHSTAADHGTIAKNSLIECLRLLVFDRNNVTRFINHFWMLDSFHLSGGLCWKTTINRILIHFWQLHRAPPISNARWMWPRLRQMLSPEHARICFFWYELIRILNFKCGQISISSINKMYDTGRNYFPFRC